MPSPSKEIETRFETTMRAYLCSKGVTESVTRSWHPFKGQYAPFYTPIADIAVGPYATRDRLIPQYNDLEASVHELIGQLKTGFRENWNCYRERYPGIVAYPFTDFLGNENARCFIAVEIESKSTSRKHKLGSIVNAAALGRIGIVVGLDEDTVSALIRILGYLKFLASVNKPTFNASNTFIMSKAQMLRILEGTDY